jgi:hypothetical protein
MVSLDKITKVTVTGTVYPADYLDTDGETITKADLEFAFNNYDEILKRDLRRIDLQHNFTATSSEVVKSWMETNEGGVLVWKMTANVYDSALISKILRGEINGYSLGARKSMGIEYQTRKVERNDFVVTKVSTGGDAEHSHLAYVVFDVSGKVVGGYTNKANDGHYHTIKSGTNTVEAGDVLHSHRLLFDELS